MSRERNVSYSKVDRTGGRSYVMPITLAAILGISVFAVDAALKRNGIDAEDTATSISSVCAGVSDVRQQRAAIAGAYSRYVVNGSGNTARNFENFDRATEDCNAGSFSFTARPEPHSESRLPEPEDAPVE